MRMKIIAGNLVAVLIVGLVSFFLVQSRLNQRVEEDSRRAVSNGHEIFARSFRLRATEFVNDTRDRASSPIVRAPYSSTNIEEVRRRAQRAVERVAESFRQASHGLTAQEPNIVLLTDARGRVLARNLDPNHNSAGQNLAESLPGLEGVLRDGRSRFDVWHRVRQQKFLGTAIAPVRAADQSIIGALVVAYDLSNGMLEDEARLIGGELAILTDGSVYSSSLASAPTTALQQRLFQEGDSRARTAAALEDGDDGAASSPWRVELAGHTYIAVVAPLPMTPSAEVAYVVLADVTAAGAYMGWSWLLLLFMVLGVIIVVVYGLYLGALFARPLEQIEEDVLAVINGNTDVRIDVSSPEFGGLAYRINQLINVFTGVPEEDSEGRVSQAPAPPADSGWEGAAFTDSVAGGATPSPDILKSPRSPVNDAEVASAVAAEPENEYWDRLYAEYVDAKGQVGEDVSNIGQERFVKRMRGNAKALTAKHGCSMVRFRVRRDGDQVILQPIIIP